MKLYFGIVLITAFTMGCVVIPIPIKNGGILEGTEFKKSELAFLQPSITTKTEVIERLGQPAIIWRDENTFVYRWNQLNWIVIMMVVAPDPKGGLLTGGVDGRGGVGQIPAEYALLVKFDPMDRLLVAEIVRKPRKKSTGQFLLDWRDTQRSVNLQRTESTP